MKKYLSAFGVEKTRNHIHAMILDHRRRYWRKIEPALFGRLVLAVNLAG